MGWEEVVGFVATDWVRVNEKCQFWSRDKETVDINGVYHNRLHPPRHSSL